MIINIFVLKGDLNGKFVVVRFFFCRVYFIIFPTAVFPGHEICQLRNSNHRLRSDVALGECDKTLDRTLHLMGEEAWP